ncbi:uncharacterized protein N7496_012687 [Penicillium cataractarum]|uniref:2EXR domain-containing protein n=1 Tax=Penicillium cataractarum TaxID=2100454 RepID=A0A9W9R856_9EURO|nr:uncharacterized protein N7496_012687 [Penicillium cataractarum]KAJ5355475.1 hypothetical protein N7496_012687 [Penicillium cataractarum]
MEKNDREFHYFSQLPTESRLAVWRECLPIRVVEIDYPWDDGVNWSRPYRPPCTLQKTTNINRCPPVISRVCRESRLVAFEAGHYRDRGSPPREARWISDLEVDQSWIDPSRDLIHLNWTPSYSAGYQSDGSALDYLSWSAGKAYGGSFMFDYLDNNRDGDVDIEERIGALQQLRHGLVVMNLIVVHTTFERAAQKGLFGLLGDACVQLVDVSDEARLNAFYEFAEKCQSEAKGFVTRKQDFRRESAESVERSLNDKLAYTFGAEAARKLPPLRPAIMFRFCPQWCHHFLGSRSAQDIAKYGVSGGRNSLSGGRRDFRWSPYH